MQMPKYKGIWNIRSFQYYLLFKETSEYSFTPQPTVMLMPFVDSC